MSRRIWIYVGLGAAMILTTVAVVVVTRKRRNRPVPPKIWRKVGQVTSLIVYPVKSCKGIEMDDMECTPHGVIRGQYRDRVFAVSEKDLTILSLRSTGKMANVTPSCHADELWLDAPGMPTFKLKLPRSYAEVDGEKIVRVREWRDKLTKAVDCGSQVGAWLSKYILDERRELKLLYCMDQDDKSILPKWAQFNRGIKEYTEALPGDAAYMLLSENSIEDLNKRLAEKQKHVTSRNFRPNILVKTEKPYVENEWKWIRIGDVVLKATMPCGRCLTTTVDPDTGIRDPNFEPLKTLKSYRRTTDPIIRRLVGEDPLFGAYFDFYSAEDSVHIRKGDDIWAAVTDVEYEM